MDVEYCNYDEIDNKIKEYISTKAYLSYDDTFITDISVNEVNADILNYTYENGNKITLIDHHATADWLNKYEWAYVNNLEISIYPQEDFMKSSGTSLFYHYLWENYNVNLPYLLEFIEKVRRYDTWEWSTKFNDEYVKQLNDLFWLIGRDKFVDRFINNPSIKFTDGEKLLLEVEQQRINTYIEKKLKQMFESEFEGYKVGVVFAEQYQSQLGNILAKNNPHLDFVVMIDVGNNTISYRSIHDHIHLGEFAKKFNGGGHAKAAGSRIDDDIKKQIWYQFVNC